MRTVLLVLAAWSTLSVVTAFGLGALIGRGKILRG